eukprot:Plantae.Rhodophyta-Palmaria_palmata.ctg12021.p3 GENE.Plantae.Rhodophyta-Palmaria_palmata.ctg12021~~Plantae.Rhodophyta-Palmaria_palmata.ctg12021.p3  ORF type:complete len:112 (-),score=19.30 Plantae.Rhodophyta-Palmaria_palmata.ctg12021:318-653(-)
MEDLVRSLRPICPTSITVTHVFSTVRRTAERVIFLHDGKIRWDGAVSALDCTNNAYIRQFFSAAYDGPMSFVEDVELEEHIGADDGAGDDAELAVEKSREDSLPPFEMIWP